MRGEQYKKKLWMDWDMADSEAFISLSGLAAQVLIYFFRKRRMVPVPKRNSEGKKEKDFVCANDGEIQFSYKEAKERYGIGFQAFSRVLSELVEKGFIEIVVPGIGIGKAYTLYGFSERWEKWGTDAFVEKERRPRRGHRFGTGEDHWKHSEGRGDNENEGV